MQVGGSSLCCLKTAPNESVSGVLTVVAIEMCLLPGRVQGSDLGVASKGEFSGNTKNRVSLCNSVYVHLLLKGSAWN